MPQGALQIADNVVINTQNKADSRRGQTQYGNPLGEDVNKLFNYANTLLVNYGDKLAYDAGNGNWTDYTGTYEAPSSGFKIRSLEALKNFYFTTSGGIYKLDAINATPRPSGVVRALGGTAVTTGTTGFLLADSAVAYRMIWGYRDANNNLVLGAPSQRLVVQNSGTDPVDVVLTYQIPDTITTEYFYQIYRSFGTAAATDEPSDELQLVIQGNPTSGELAAKEFTVTDITPYDLMRATLYTSPSQEGIENANYEPPFAIDMDVFKGCAFYANIRQRQALTIALISVEFPSLGYFVDASVGTTNLSPILTGISSTADLRVGMRCVGSGIPANAKILTIDSPTQVTMTANASATASVSVEFQDRLTIGGVDYWAGSAQDVSTNTFFADDSGSPGQNINATALSIVEVVNKSASNTLLYAYYLSGLEDLPGQLLFQERGLGGSTFYATSTAGESFSPPLPVSGTTVASENDARQNRVAISKQGQVEAVPLYSYFDVGSANFPIERVVALRDGIFFFKQDGIFRLSGETFANFVVDLLDNTVTLQVPESAVAFNNQVFCYTTQGVCAVTDAGVQIMSVPIEGTLLELSSEQYTNFSTASFGVAYESARQYQFWTVTQTTDTYATQAFIYNSLTSTWTRWVLNRTCGIVGTSVNKLFMAQPETGQVLIERKNYTNSDYADEEYQVTIVSVDSEAEVTLADVTDVSVGMTLVQGERQYLIEEINGDVLTLTSTVGLTAAAATVYEPIMNMLQWAPIDCENPGLMKQFSEISLFFRNAAFQIIDVTFESNITAGSTTVPVQNISLGGWGQFPWGEEPWGGVLGGEAVLRTYVTPEQQRAHWILITLSTEEAFTGFSLQGLSIWFNPMSPRVK